MTGDTKANDARSLDLDFAVPGRPGGLSASLDGETSSSLVPVILQLAVVSLLSYSVLAY